MFHGSDLTAAQFRAKKQVFGEFNAGVTAPTFVGHLIIWTDEDYMSD